VNFLSEGFRLNGVWIVDVSCSDPRHLDQSGTESRYKSDPIELGNGTVSICQHGADMLGSWLKEETRWDGFDAEGALRSSPQSATSTSTAHSIH
jgi:hypothetical protein